MRSAQKSAAPMRKLRTSLRRKAKTLVPHCLSRKEAARPRGASGRSRMAVLLNVGDGPRNGCVFDEDSKNVDGPVGFPLNSPQKG